VRPLTVLTAIVLGSSVATTFGLGATLIVFLVLSGETPRFREELPLLSVYVAIFAGLTTLAAVSFIGQGAGAALAQLGAGCHVGRAGWAGGIVFVEPVVISLLGQFGLAVGSTRKVAVNPQISGDTRASTSIVTLPRRPCRETVSRNPGFRRLAQDLHRAFG
jgi:hypothetical protein